MDCSWARPRCRSAAFWAITLILPIAVTALILELGVRACARSARATHAKKLDERLRDSERTEVSVVTAPTLMGIVRPSTNRDIVYELKPNHRWMRSLTSRPRKPRLFVVTSTPRYSTCSPAIPVPTPRATA